MSVCMLAIYSTKWISKFSRWVRADETFRWQRCTHSCRILVVSCQVEPVEAFLAACKCCLRLAALLPLRNASPDDWSPSEQTVYLTHKVTKTWELSYTFSDMQVEVSKVLRTPWNVSSVTLHSKFTSQEVTLFSGMQVEVLISAEPGSQRPWLTNT